MFASVQPEEDKIMDAVLKMKNVQMEMMQMLVEMREEIFRIRQYNENNGEGSSANLDDKVVSFSSSIIYSLRTKMICIICS